MDTDAAEPRPLQVYCGMPAYAPMAPLQPLTRFYNPRCDRLRRDGDAGRRLKVNGLQIALRTIACSLLARNFNALWCEALNGVVNGERYDFDYFVMQHADVEPEELWIEKLVLKMLELDADCISAVIPIKTLDGVTSTGIASPDGSPWHVYTRLTLSEVHNLLPPTFSKQDTIDAGLNPHGGALLVNTGCMILNLRRPWCRERDADGHARFSFCIRDSIAFDENGMAHPVMEPEDWRMSRFLDSIGARVFATREIAVSHHGAIGFSNTSVYGYEQDRASAAFREAQARQTGAAQ